MAGQRDTVTLVGVAVSCGAKTPLYHARERGETAYGTNPSRGLTKKIPAKPPVTGTTPLLK